MRRTIQIRFGDCDGKEHIPGSVSIAQRRMKACFRIAVISQVHISDVCQRTTFNAIRSPRILNHDHAYNPVHLTKGNDNDECLPMHTWICFHLRDGDPLTSLLGSFTGFTGGGDKQAAYGSARAKHVCMMAWRGLETLFTAAKRQR